MNTSDPEVAERIAEIEGNINNLQDSLVRLKEREGDYYDEQTSFKNQVGRLHKNIAQLPAEVQGPLRASLEHLSSLHQTSLPWALWIPLGSANLLLPDRQRLAYKAEYERFKITITMVHLATAIVQLLMPAGWPQRLLDTAGYFIVLYSYSTMTLREHILRYNGSRIRDWWLIHHYICIGLSGCMLIWPHGANFQTCRTPMLHFTIYTAAIQTLQYRYQMQRLYTLRALSKVDAMQTTTDTAQVHVGPGADAAGLTRLLPFLLGANAWQLYMAWLHWHHRQGEWQPPVIAILFAILGIGNAMTTLAVLLQKRKEAKLKQ